MKKILKPLASVIVLVVIDQVTKALAVKGLKGNAGIIIIPNVFQLLYVENRGMAWGTFSGFWIMFTIITIVLLSLVTFFYFRIEDNKKYLLLKIIMVVFFAGGIGNLIDRVTNHYVVDFLYFSLIDFPVFNVADIYVTVSAFIFFILALFRYKDEELSSVFSFKRKN